MLGGMSVAAHKNEEKSWDGTFLIQEGGKQTQKSICSVFK